MEPPGGPLAGPGHLAGYVGVGEVAGLPVLGQLLDLGLPAQLPQHLQLGQQGGAAVPDVLPAVQVLQLLEVVPRQSSGSIWAINLSEKDGNITNLGNIHYYEEIKQGNNGNIGNNGDN